eukprot:m.77675 g.77675  ORF g.77675 m.77675 type:complete len:85 (-) comp14076_c1_seq2:322-576(-)
MTGRVNAVDDVNAVGIVDAVNVVERMLKDQSQVVQGIGGGGSRKTRPEGQEIKIEDVEQARMGEIKMERDASQSTVSMMQTQRA